MDTVSVCCSCTLELNKADEIVCKGFCRSAYHINCVNIPDNIRDSVKTYAQLFWMCVACTKMMENATFCQAIASTNSAIDAGNDGHNKVLTELRNEIKQNTIKINSILNHLPTPSPARFATPRKINLPDNSRKRPRVDVEPRTESSSGTKDEDSSVIVPLATRQEKVELFWLYLSGFDPKATEDNIRELVKSNLDNGGTVDVRKLVPKGKNLDELTFVSFKVGINPELKDTALLPATWQKGITFREFDFHTRDTFQFRR